MMKQPKLSVLTACVLLAAVLFYLIFVAKILNFWLSMCIGTFSLAVLSLILSRAAALTDRFRPRHLLLGIASAAVLYGVFYLGNIVSGWIIPGKDTLVGSVYLNRGQTSPWLIGLALLLVIGPGEEIFWRGFVQRTLTTRFGGKAVLLSAVLYAAVHVVTLNIMLIGASLICGLFWGYLYHREKNIGLVIVSHALWDVSVFLLFPLG